MFSSVSCLSLFLCSVFISFTCEKTLSTSAVLSGMTTATLDNLRINGYYNSPRPNLSFNKRVMQFGIDLTSGDWSLMNVMNEVHWNDKSSLSILKCSAISIISSYPYVEGMSSYMVKSNNDNLSMISESSNLQEKEIDEDNRCIYV